MIPEDEAILFEAAGIVEDSPEQTEATTELEAETDTEEVEVEETEEDTEAEAEDESPDDESDNEDAEEETEEESEDDAEDIEFEFEGETFTANRLRDLRDKEKNLTAMITRKAQAYAEKGKELDSKLDSTLEVAELFENQLKAPLAHFEQMDWNSLKVNEPEKYTAYRQQYQQAQAGMDQVQAHIGKLKAAKAEQAAEAQKQQASEAWEVLSDRHSDWSSELYQKAMTHAVEKLGFSQEQAHAELNPAVIDLWLTDLRRAEIAHTVKKQPKSVKRTLKAKTSKPVDPKAKKAAESRQLRQKARSGDDNAAKSLIAADMEAMGIF